jgi:hypothetical protein
MKRFLLAVILLGLSTAAFAQSDAQKSFDNLKKPGRLMGWHCGWQADARYLARHLDGQRAHARDEHGGKTG